MSIVLLQTEMALHSVLSRFFTTPQALRSGLQRPASESAPASLQGEEGSAERAAGRQRSRGMPTALPQVRPAPEREHRPALVPVRRAPPAPARPAALLRLAALHPQGSLGSAARVTWRGCPRCGGEWAVRFSTRSGMSAEADGKSAGRPDPGKGTRWWRLLARVPGRTPVYKREEIDLAR